MPVSTVFSRDPTAAPRAARAYRGGASLRELAAEWGVSYSKVRLVLLGEGVTLRPKGGARSRAARDQHHRAGSLSWNR